MDMTRALNLETIAPMSLLSFLTRVYSIQQSFNTKIIKKTKKKESMFATSESGKVGVVGSGKGMTEFQLREKYIKSKAGTLP